jgi:hypothetical protein
VVRIHPPLSVPCLFLRGIVELIKGGLNASETDSTSTRARRRGEIDESGVTRDRMVTHPSDNRYDDDRAANEAADAALRAGGDAVRW